MPNPPAAAGTGGPRDLLDALWKQGQYGKLVDALDVHVRQLEAISIAKLDAPSVESLIGDLYVLQHRLVGMLNHLSVDEEPAATRRCLQLAQRVGRLQTDAFERAVALDNVNSDKPVVAWQVFRNTLKEQGFHTPTRQEQYFIEKLREFQARGGRLSDIKQVTPEEVGKLENGALMEWTVNAYDIARMARGDSAADAGHTLLAWGEDVLAAGSMRVFKKDNGDIQKIILGTFSGHFRSGAQYLVHMARHLAAAGVPPERIIMHAGEASTPRGLEIIHRAMGKDGAETQRQVAQLEAEAQRYNPYAPVKKEKKKKAPAGQPIHGSCTALQSAVFTMESVAGNVLANSMVLESIGEASALAAAIQKVMTLAQEAGSPLAFRQGAGMIQHLASLQPPHVDADAQAVFKQLVARWADVKFGEGVADPAAVLGPKPHGNHRTRVVATLNPSVSVSKLQDMLMAGMTTARLNTAHGTADELKACIARIRQAASEVGREVAVQIDLAGPKIRLGKFKNPQNLEFNDIWLKTGDKVTLTTEDVLGDNALLPVNYPALADDVAVGQRILMNDGLVVLEATAVDKDPKTGVATVEATVVQGDKVWDNKGINLPDSSLSIDTITDSDYAMMDALLDDVDLVALSFVKDGMDVAKLREYMVQKGRVLPIIAKIERAEAIDKLQEIAIVSDGMMVARGDLGVEVGYEKVPGIERRINALGNQLGKPTMVATEVLISMVKDATRPSRGDVQALYTAVADQGADAIMLGKETSFPEHAPAVVRAAVRVIEQAEKDLRDDVYRQARAVPPERLNAVTARLQQLKDSAA